MTITISPTMQPTRTVAPFSGSGERFAALDLGTNNCRLLIARRNLESGGHGLKVVDSFSRIVRLGEGLSATSALSEEAIERTLEALAVCRRKMDRHRIRHSRCVATEACRRALNSQDFLRRVRRETGIELEIITSEEEAALAFAGCASLLRTGAQRALVFDIGGGSTELLWATVDGNGKPFIAEWASIPCGVMNLSEAFGSDVRSEDAYLAMKQRVASSIGAFAASAASLNAEDVQLLCTSGTVTTLAAIHLDLPRYNRSVVDGSTLQVSDIRAAAARLLSMPLSERYGHPCVGPERADFIIAGCAIMEAILDRWPLPDITIADRGVREGIIFSLMHA